MNTAKLSQRLPRRAYKVVQIIVRLVSLLIFILLFTFVFLRLYGVPEPLLREVVHRANVSGIPVDIERIKLTLKGWRASGVSYYSKHPDDLAPVFYAREVLFVRRGGGDGSSKERNFDITAVGVAVSPSVEWGVDIPAESASRLIDKVHLSLDFMPDRIIVSDGTISWLGVRFNVGGVVLKSVEQIQKSSVPSVRKQDTVFPVYVSAHQFQTLEDRLKSIKLNGGAEMDIRFSVDTGNYAASWADLSLQATDVSVRDVRFSHVDIAGHYAYPTVELDRAVLSRGNQSFRLTGNYDLESGEVEGELRNTITSKRLLLLLPQLMTDLFAKVALQFETLPELSLNYGPAQPAELLNHLSGSFSIRDVSYCQLVIDSLRGKVIRSNNRLELTQLEGSVLGQEERAEEVGSCMMGGSATGEVFWDANTREFGVSASGSFDPHLLRGAMANVPVANQAIERFQFKERPPQVSLELGACYEDWDTFFINVHGQGNEVRVHEALFSSFSTSAYYKQGVLKLDPITATKGSDFMEGSASLDFFESTVTFDTFGSIPPITLEDAIHPGFNLFGNRIMTEGNTQVKARGVLDWGSMRETDFTAEVEAEWFEIPVVGMDSFSALITGKGPLVSVKDISFGLYGGEGLGEFSIRLEPGQTAMPYDMEIEIKEADFLECLRFLIKGGECRVSGKLFAKVQFAADMMRDFFETANGHGEVSVDDGQLADLPFFSGFSRLMRKVIPRFKVFSITGLRGTFDLKEGVIHSQDAYFEGNVLSAKGKGSYSKNTGFDALVQAQILSDNNISKVFRAITDPLFKLFEMKLNGTLSEPSWHLEKFKGSGRAAGSAEDGAESD